MDHKYKSLAAERYDAWLKKQEAANKIDTPAPATQISSSQPSTPSATKSTNLGSQPSTLKAQPTAKLPTTTSTTASSVVASATLSTTASAASSSATASSAAASSPKDQKHDIIKSVSGGKDYVGGKDHVYVLLCQGGKFYIGESRDVDARFQQHVQGNGSLAGAAWTRKYEPIEIFRSFPSQSRHDENNTTIDLMMEHGIRNVRGGSYCAIKLSRTTRRSIKQQMATLRKQCFHCGEKTHMASRCPNRADRAVAWVDYDSELEDANMQHYQQGDVLYQQQQQVQAQQQQLLHMDEKERPPLAAAPAEALIDTLPLCARCGRIYHDASQCYARSHVHGQLLPPK